MAIWRYSPTGCDVFVYGGVCYICVYVVAFTLDYVISLWFVH